jgi:hypothetical protein
MMNTFYHTLHLKINNINYTCKTNAPIEYLNHIKPL